MWPTAKVLTEPLQNKINRNHGRTGRKKLGGRKEICPTFSDCARPVPKKLFVEQINFGDLPPPKKKANIARL